MRERPHGALGLLLAGCAFLGLGCSLFIEKEAAYLETAQGRAGREEVERRLGRPYLVAAAHTGEPIWVYQIRTAEQGGNNSWSVIGYWCDEYVLSFDRQGILRSWSKKSQKHRDDRDQPDVCVTNGFSSAR